ncbi:MAG: thioredoxin [Proteobacteria bacterium]|nr:thioredoxin [Pseudomonadota bacterium]
MSTSNTIVVACTKCGTKNRIPLDRKGDKPICGKCRSPLPKTPVYDHPLTITDGSFQQEVIKCPGAVMVDCWAPWCGPCKMIAPVLDQLAKTYAGKLKITKLNVDENPQVSSRYTIQSIPTMLFFKNGKLVKTLVGAQPRMAIEKQIQGMI